MVVVDRLSKGAHFSALKEGFTAADVTQAFIKDVVKLHGFPTSIVSDRDPIFMSKFWRELFKQQGTLLANSTAYHPQSDGQTEVVNRSIEDYLRCFVGEQQTGWVSLLPWAEFSYNTAHHSAIGMSPFEAMYGRPPPSILEHVEGTANVAAVEELLVARDQLLKQLKENLARAQLRMQQQANKKRQDKSFEVGEFVWVKLQPYRQSSARTRLSHKLAKRYYGPFQIVAKIGPVAYRVGLPQHAKIHNVFHVSLLRRFVGDPSSVPQNFPTKFQGQRPIVIPEQVLDRRMVHDVGQWKTQLLVKWQGLPADETSWELEEVMRHEFPEFNLEDKADFDGGGNDTHVTDQMKKGVGEWAEPTRRVANI